LEAVIADDAARHENSIVRGKTKQLVRVLIIPIGLASRSRLVRDEVVPRVDHVEGVCKNEFHRAALVAYTRTSASDSPRMCCRRFCISFQSKPISSHVPRVQWQCGDIRL